MVVCVTGSSMTPRIQTVEGEQQEGSQRRADEVADNNDNLCSTDRNQ
jgi:hypothetical protein